MNAPTTARLPEVDALRATAALPFDQARAMPPEVYTSPDFARLEQEAIFEQGWVAVGRIEQIAEPGAYIAYELAGRPVFVIRDRAGDVRAFSNVCLHRMSTLLEGTGVARRITCPYHGWTYDTEGRLVGAAAMEGSCGFDKGDYQLPQIRTEIWNGWILITLNPAAPPVAATLAPLAEEIADYEVDRYVQSFHETFVWDTNWKCLAENFMESYHLHVCHRGTIGPNTNLAEMACKPGAPAYNIHSLLKTWDAPLQTAHPANSRLTGDRRRETHIIAVYPSFLITLSPGYFWWLSLHPQGPDKVHVTYGGGLSPEHAADPDGARHFEDVKALLDRVNDEDRLCTERVYRGLRSGLARPGHLSRLEQPLYDFARWLSDRVSNPAGG